MSSASKKPEEQEKKQIWLIPELCLLTGPSLLEKASFFEKKDVTDKAKLPPEQRHEMVRSLMNNINENETAKNEMANMQMKFETDVVKCEAKWFKTVPIIFGNNRIVTATDRGWDRELKESHPIESVHLVNWLLIYNYNDVNLARDFKEKLLNISSRIGFRIENGTEIEAPKLLVDYINRLKTAINNQERGPQMVVCIIPKRDDIYQAIKRVCCVEKGIPSQCVTTDLLKKKDKLMSVITKVAIQMNCKLGAQIWAAHMPVMN